MTLREREYNEIAERSADYIEQNLMHSAKNERDASLVFCRILSVKVEEVLKRRNGKK